MQPVTISAPASKSVSHRALIAAALAPGESELSGVLVSNDTTGATLPCLLAMGATFTRDGGDVRVRGMADGPRGATADSSKPVLLDVGESGTTCRLLTAIAAAGRGAFEVRGAGRMHQRPMAELTTELHSQGVDFQWLEKVGYLPFVMRTEGLRGGPAAVSLEESSQYLSGLLLAAPLAAKPMQLSISGAKVVSWPYVALSLQVMEDFGIPFTVETRQGDAWQPTPWREVRAAEPGKVRFIVQPSRYAARAYTVEGDWSNASYFLGAGAVSRAVAMTGLRADSVQGDRAILRILQNFGASVIWDSAGTVSVSPGELHGIDVDMGQCPDLVPTVAMVALFAKGETIIRNVAHLRIKESDRLEAVAGAIRAVDSQVEVLPDGLRIAPRALPTGKSVDFATHSDHRMAMSFTLLRLGGVDVRLDDPRCVAKSFPGFFEEWAKVEQGT
ncbi:3-phosphoshikimate 1-carboxyvinyltransferase [Desulfocurvibacter africanus]|uniref:3-phosphoshikimate 1-carboxyvinyltransferase n=1 Tax=Desulfocurvibacter africanus subsp. africanus str. Walvis Bay TaxID=690850 RepID=F3Z2P2_DESAF|nr:3-phosphoshikimate 1-carboxyvinyltransferase [Desulfocurvibacter africanus]EGJ50209.1 3-phosphoshikimate 1-carboxyvinyltransferase [Desulfocurvibacter africanus subsp. africanus str. Walvis Bay]